jgi:hypothetical protein
MEKREKEPRAVLVELNGQGKKQSRWRGMEKV